MKLSLCLICTVASVCASAPASAVIIDVPLGAIIVPPTQTFTPGLTFTQAGANGANFEFIISQAMTLTVSSFTNSSIGGTGIFDFSSIGLYAGVGTAGQLLQSGAITIDGNTRRASLNQFSLNQGAYTIAFRGNVTGAPAGVGSNITFAAGASPIGAVPEPATWAMMTLGFGGVGYAMRRMTKVNTRIRFA
ncbi:MAG: PEP-CTERM sorting domain-containing protein [Oxalobacteraceae bacterium]|nr:MAG: PEP-CTERM sorting domain-containing protein [Oxalobacteraceae bacterium]